MPTPAHHPAAGRSPATGPTAPLIASCSAPGVGGPAQAVPDRGRGDAPHGDTTTDGVRA